MSHLSPLPRPPASARWAAALVTGALALVSSVTLSCGPRLVAGEPAKTPEPSEAAQPEPAAPAAEPSAVDPPKESEPQVKASDVLSAPDKAWVFSFRGSAAYEKAEKRCDERHAEDLAARARCITRARDEFTADAMEFTQDDAGRDVWVIYREKKNKMIQIYSVPIEYGEQQGDTVTIRKVGRATGKALLFSNVSEFGVKLADEYSLELQDKQHGRLAYDARLGLFTNQ